LWNFSACGSFEITHFVRGKVEARGFSKTKQNAMKIKILLAMMLVSVLALGSGCALFVVGGAAAAGAGGYAYVNGELKETEGVSMDTAYNATLAAMGDLQYAVVSKPKDALTATITARTADDKKIVVKLEKKSASATEIRLRVGTLGDRAVSQQIIERIKSHF
jgi:hypothetical protein